MTEPEITLQDFTTILHQLSAVKLTVGRIKRVPLILQDAQNINLFETPDLKELVFRKTREGWRILTPIKIIG
jgi:hypothetical protein